MQIAVVENSAPRRDLEGTLLLPGGAVDKILVVHHLQPHQTATDQRDPADKEERDMQKAKAATDDPGPLTGSSHRAPGRGTCPLPRG